MNYTGSEVADVVAPWPSHSVTACGSQGTVGVGVSVLLNHLPTAVEAYSTSTVGDAARKGRDSDMQLGVVNV
jgi:hypothetical protein